MALTQTSQSTSHTLSSDAMEAMEEVDLVEDSMEIFAPFHAIEDLAKQEEITQFHWPPCFLFPTTASTISSPNYVRRLCYFLYCDAYATQVLNLLEIPHLIPSTQERMYGVMVGDMLRLPQNEKEDEIHRRIQAGEEKEGMVEHVSKPVKVIVVNALAHYAHDKHEPVLWIQDHEGTWYELLRPCRFEYNSVYVDIEQALSVKGDESMGYGRKYVSSITEYAIFNQHLQQDTLINFQPHSTNQANTWTVLGRVQITIASTKKTVNMWMKIDIKEYEVHLGGRQEDNDPDFGIWICSHQGAWYKLTTPFISYVLIHRKMQEDLLSASSYDHRNAYYKDYHRTVTNYSFLDHQGYFIPWYKIMKDESNDSQCVDSEYCLLRGNLVSKESSDAPSLVPMAVYVKRYVVDLGKKPGDELTLFVQGSPDKVWYKLQGDPSYAYKTFKDVPRDVETYVKQFNWPSETKEVWRRVCKFTVMDAKGKMVSIIVTNKTAYLRGYMMPHKNSTVKHLQLYVQIYLDRYSIDYGISMEDPNRGFWLQDIHNHWYKVEEPPALEYQDVARDGLDRTNEFLRLHEAMIFLYCDEICEADASGMAICKHTIQEVFEIANFHFDLKFIQQNKDFVESNLTALVSLHKSRKFFSSIKNLTAEDVEEIYKSKKAKISAAQEARLKATQKSQAAKEAREAKELAKEAAKEAAKVAKTMMAKEPKEEKKKDPVKAVEKEITPSKREEKKKEPKSVEKEKVTTPGKNSEERDAKRRYTAADIRDSDFEFSSDEEEYKTPQKKVKTTIKTDSTSKQTPSATKGKPGSTPFSTANTDAAQLSSADKPIAKRKLSEVDSASNETQKPIAKRVLKDDDEEDHSVVKQKKSASFEDDEPPANSTTNSNTADDHEDGSTPRNGGEKSLKRETFPCSYCKGLKKNIRCMNRGHIDGFQVNDVPRGNKPYIDDKPRTPMTAAFCSICNSLSKQRYCTNRSHREGELVMVPVTKPNEVEPFVAQLSNNFEPAKRAPTISVIGTCTFCKTLQKRLNCINKEHRDGEMVVTIKNVDGSGSNGHDSSVPLPSPRPSRFHSVPFDDEDDDEEADDSSKLRIAEEKERERYYRAHHVDHFTKLNNHNTEKSPREREMKSINQNNMKVTFISSSTRSFAPPLPHDRHLKPKKSVLKKESSLPAMSADPVLLQLESALVSTSSDKPGVRWKDMEGRSNLREVFTFEEYEESPQY